MNYKNLIPQKVKLVSPTTGKLSSAEFVQLSEEGMKKIVGGLSLDWSLTAIPISQSQIENTSNTQIANLQGNGSIVQNNNQLQTNAGLNFNSQFKWF